MYLSKINYVKENFSQQLLPSPKNFKKQVSTHFFGQTKF